MLRTRFVVAVSACCALASFAGAQPVVQVLAIRDQVIPSAGGAAWGAPSRVLGDGIDIVANAGLNSSPSTSNSALLLLQAPPNGDGQTWNVAARKGSSSGGLSIFFFIDSMVRSSTVASIALTQDSPVGDIIPTLIVAPPSQPWSTVVRARTSSGVGNTTFGNLETAQINGQGELLFRSALLGTDAPVGTTQTYWLQRGASRQLLLRQGTNVPTTLITEFIGAIQSGALADRSNDATLGAFALTSLAAESIVIRMSAPVVGSPTWTQLYRAPTSNFGGGSRGGALLAGLSLAYEGNTLAFVVEQKNAGGAVTGEALLRSDNGAQAEPIARSGQPAGTNLTFVNLEQEAPAVFGQVLAFRGRASRAAGPAQGGVWWQPVAASAPALLALAGEPAVADGMPAGATWVSVSPPRTGPTQAGTIGTAFSATIAGPGITSNDNVVACLQESSTSSLRVVLRKGATLSLPTGGVGTLSDFSLAGRGVTESINQTGLTTQGIVFVGSLTDGRSVILRVSDNQAGCDSIDFNRDGLFPDDNDLVDFLVVLAGGSCSNDPSCGSIDFNGDGLFPDDNDLIAFLCQLAGGASCCP